MARVGEYKDDPITDQDVEIVARAISWAHGYDPDELVDDTIAKVPSKVPAWLLMRTTARTHIAAFRACSSHLIFKL
jgi:hypothetical protein